MSESTNPFEQCKWSVYVYGPDEIHYCKSFEAAVIEAASINQVIIDLQNQGEITENHPILYAIIERDRLEPPDEQ